jgi:hypothetical protein
LNKNLFNPSPIEDDIASRQHIFGLFGEQPDVPDFQGTLQELIDASKLVLHESQSAVEAWHALELEYKEPYHRSAIQHAKELSEAAHPSRQPLVDVVLLHRFDFNRSMSLWPTVKSRHQAVLFASRKSGKLQQSIQDRLNLKHRGVPPIAKKMLKELLSKLRAKFWVCCSIFEQASELDRLAVVRAKLLEDGWNRDVFQMGTDDLMQLCHGLSAWCDKTYSLLKDLMNIYIHQWNTYGMKDFEPLPNKLLYHFGCPHKDLIGSTANCKFN